eukprot:303471-Pelagomonas_calceolata.AAC.3
MLTLASVVYYASSPQQKPIWLIPWFWPGGCDDVFICLCFNAWHSLKKHYVRFKRKGKDRVT